MIRNFDVRLLIVPLVFSAIIAKLIDCEKNASALQTTVEQSLETTLRTITDHKRKYYHKQACVHTGNSVCCCAVLTIFYVSKNEVCNCIWLQDGDNRTLGHNITINGRKRNEKKTPFELLKENHNDNSNLCGRYNFLLMTLFCTGLDIEHGEEDTVTICPNIMSRTLAVLECKLYFGCFQLK